MPKDISRLIPIKKPITDIQKGLIIRTYYYKPQTLLKQFERLKEEPNINYFSETPFYNEYETYLKTQDKSQFAKLFPDNIWKKISDINNSEEINKHYESKIVYPLTSFILSGDKLFLKNFRKDIKNLTKEIVIESYGNYKFKYKQTQLKIKEKKVYNVVKISDLLSNLLNYYNPRKPKINEIVKKLIGSDYIDDSGVIHHCVFSERIINRDKLLFLNILRSNINMFYSVLLESKKDNKHLQFYIPYYLVEIFKIDISEFENILKTYYFSPTIEEFIKEIKNNKISDKLNILYSQIVNIPKNELTNLLKDTILNKNNKRFDFDDIILRALSQRFDITSNEFDFIFSSFLNKYNDFLDFETLLSNLILFFFENEPPSIFSLAFLFCLYNKSGKIPLMFVKEFKNTPPEYGSILFLLQNGKNTQEYFNKLINLKPINNQIKCYIPIIKKSDVNVLKSTKIPYRLLDFHLATTNEELLKNRYVYIELQVNKYYKLTNNFILISL